MIIQTARLILRPFVKNDINWYYDLIQDKELTRRLPGLIATDMKQVEKDIELFEKSDFVNDFYYVINNKENNIMGIIVAVRITPTVFDISYFLKKQYRHNGYMGEALANLAATLRRMNLEYRFRMLIDNDNVDSLKVVRRFDASVQIIGNKCICFMWKKTSNINIGSLLFYISISERTVIIVI